YRRQRIEPRERVQDRPGRWQQDVQLAQDSRALDVDAQLTLARRLGHDGCHDPNDSQPERRAKRRAAQAVEQAHPGDDQRASHHEAEAFHPTREDRAREDRADQPEGGRVRRGRSLRQQKRTQARSEECTNGEAAEREHADDEAPPEPESGKDCRKRDDYPVELRHLAMFYRALTDNQTRRMRRARPVIALAGVAFALRALLGADHEPSAASTLAGQFAAAWARGDYATMYSDIDAASRRRISASEFAAAYQQALRTATGTGKRVMGKPRGAAGGVVTVPVRVQTRLFGTLALSFRVRIVNDGGEHPVVAWSRSLAFPGMLAGGALPRRTTLPRRATLLARDGSVLAAGAATEAGQRSSPLGETAGGGRGGAGAPPRRR